MKSTTFAICQLLLFAVEFYPFADSETSLCRNFEGTSDCHQSLEPAPFLTQNLEGELHMDPYAAQNPVQQSPCKSSHRIRGKKEMVCSLLGDHEVTLWAHRAAAYCEISHRWPRRIVLTTHMTIDRLSSAIERCEEFKGGLLSISLFVGSSEANGWMLLEKMKENDCLYYFADIHLLRRSSYNVLASDEIALTLEDQLQGRRVSSMSFTYPFNAQRNAAINGARGNWVFVLDIDLKISPHAYASHEAMLEHLRLLRRLAHGPRGSLHSKKRDSYYWVIGAFETAHTLVPIPATMDQFAKQHEEGKLTWFYPFCQVCYSTLDKEKFVQQSLYFRRELGALLSSECPLLSEEPISAHPIILLQRCVSELIQAGKAEQAWKLSKNLNNISDPTFELPYAVGMEPFFVINKEKLPPYSEIFIGRLCDKMQLYPELKYLGLTPWVMTGVALVNPGKGDHPEEGSLGRRKGERFSFQESQNHVAFNNIQGQIQRRERWDTHTAYYPASFRRSREYHSHLHHRDDTMIPPRPWYSRFLYIVQSRRWQFEFLTKRHDENVVCIVRSPEEAGLDPEEWDLRMAEFFKKACEVIDCSPLEEGQIRSQPEGLLYRADWILHRYWKHHFRQSSDNHASYCINGGLGELVVAHEGYWNCIPRDDLSDEKLQNELEWICDEYHLGDCREIFEEKLGVNSSDALGVGEPKSSLWSDRSLRFKTALAMTLYFSLNDPHFPIVDYPGIPNHMDALSFCRFTGDAEPLQPDQLPPLLH